MPGTTSEITLREAVEQGKNAVALAAADVDAAGRAENVKWMENATAVFNEQTAKLIRNEAALLAAYAGIPPSPPSTTFGDSAFWTINGYQFIP